MPPWILRAAVGVSAVSLGGCYLHANGMQTPTPTLHGRPAVAYAVPVPARRGIGVLYISIESDDPPAPRIAPPLELPRVRPFDTVGATAALRDVDLAPCRATGVDRGYGYARATFDPDGRVSDVVVDETGDWAPNVRSCVSQRLATARVRVREFDGPPVAVGTWLFLCAE